MNDTIKICSCGNIMDPIEIGSDIKFCSNCDRCQPNEANGGKRIPTIQDERYKRTWVRRMAA